MTKRRYRKGPTLTQHFQRFLRNGNSEAEAEQSLVYYLSKYAILNKPLPWPCRFRAASRGRLWIETEDGKRFDGEDFFTLTKVESLLDYMTDCRETSEPEVSSPEVLVFNFLVGEGEKLKGRKEFYQGKCKTEFGVGSHVFNVQWLNAHREIGLPIRTRTKRKARSKKGRKNQDVR